MIKSILHPSDFSESSQMAFCHALKLALMLNATLTLMHVAEGPEADGSGFPGVRETLEHWGVLQPGSPREAVADLGVEVKKIVTRHGDPLKSTLHYMEKHPADLIVLATHSYEGASRLLHRSIAEPLARESREMTLFLPQDARGFVSREDGSISLASILVPIDHRPLPQPALDAACFLARALGLSSVTFTLFHVCPTGDMPDLQIPEPAGWTWRKIVADDNDAVSAIRQAAVDVSADLTVMATAGHEGFLDALRGSTTERVLRGSRHPVLAVPARPTAAQQ